MWIALQNDLTPEILSLCYHGRTSDQPHRIIYDIIFVQFLYKKRISQNMVMNHYKLTV